MNSPAVEFGRLDNQQEWEDFVTETPGGTFFHTVKWKKVLEECFSMETEYVAVRDSNRNLIAICPFAIHREAGLFKVMDSLPISDFAGPLIKPGYELETTASLREHLLHVGAQRGATYVRIRCPNTELRDALIGKGSRVDTSFGTMRLDLEGKPSDFIWNKIFSQKGGQRTYIKRFEKDGFQNKEAKSLEDLRTFYTLYHVRHHGYHPL